MYHSFTKYHALFKGFVWSLIHSLLQPCEVGAIIILMVHMRKLRQGEVK